METLTSVPAGCSRDPLFLQETCRTHGHTAREGEQLDDFRRSIRGVGVLLSVLSFCQPAKTEEPVL